MKELVQKTASSDVASVATAATTGVLGVGSLAANLQTWLSISATGAALLLTFYMIRYRILEIRRIKLEIQRMEAAHDDPD